MPVNFGQVMERLDQVVKSVGATIPDYLCLSDHTSKWNMDVILAVDKEIPGAKNMTLIGDFTVKFMKVRFAIQKNGAKISIN